MTTNKRLTLLGGLCAAGLSTIFLNFVSNLGFDPAGPSSDPLPVISGKSSQPNTEIRIFLDDDTCSGTPLTLTVSDGSGNFSVPVPVPSNEYSTFYVNDPTTCYWKKYRHLGNPGQDPTGPVFDVPGAEWSSVASNGNGDWVATQYDLFDGWADAVEIRTSSDNGLTWTPRESLSTTATYASVDYASGLFGLATGGIWQAEFRSSSDQGMSWSEPIVFSTEPHAVESIALAGADGVWAMLYHQTLYDPGMLWIHDGSTGVLLRTSVDDGATWSEPLLLADEGLDVDIEASETGVWLASWIWEGTWVARSEDGGRSWGTPVKLTEEAPAVPWSPECDFSDNQAACYKGNGPRSIVARAVLATDEQGTWLLNDGLGGYLVSRDDGITWGPRQQFPSLQASPFRFVRGATYTGDHWILAGGSPRTLRTLASLDPEATPDHWVEQVYEGLPKHRQFIHLESGADGTTILAWNSHAKALSSTLPECADGLDNDGDGLIDYPDDLGCEFSELDDEAAPDPVGCAL